MEVGTTRPAAIINARSIISQPSASDVHQCGADATSTYLWGGVILGVLLKVW
jgi:hypothetical protein